MSLLIKFIEDMNRRLKKFNIIDMKFAQGSAMFLAFILVKLFPQIMIISIWWFVALFLICAIKPMYVFYFKK